MRGKQSYLHASAFASGITPADAGKTLRVFGFKLLDEDHPRGCGENYILNCEVEHLAGSPPRMRGKLAVIGGMIAVTRITPADAGKTKGEKRTGLPAKDHPRGCGENFLPAKALTNPAGSPPRMRGKHRLATAGLQSTRITPADAGKTLQAFV